MKPYKKEKKVYLLNKEQDFTISYLQVTEILSLPVSHSLSLFLFLCLCLLLCVCLNFLEAFQLHDLVSKPLGSTCVCSSAPRLLVLALLHAVFTWVPGNLNPGLHASTINMLPLIHLHSPFVALKSYPPNKFMM